MTQRGSCRVARAALALLLVAVGALGVGARAETDDYPSGAIKLILPQPAGGAVDLIARRGAGRLTQGRYRKTSG
jgi:tripartite-type tricarboxylate transporter receptor subunit TctC